MKSISSKKKDSFIKKLLKVLFVFVFLVFVAFILKKVDFRNIWTSIKSIPPYLIISMLLLQLVTQFALNFQWYRLFKVLNLKTSFSKLLVVNSYGMLGDALTPGEKVGGEVVRVLQLNRILGTTARQAASVVALQKSLSAAALIFLNLVAIISMSGQIDFLKSTFIRVFVLLLLVILCFVFIYLLFFTQKLNKSVQKIKANNKIALLFKNWINTFAKDTSLIANRPGEWFLQFVLSFGIWLLFPIKLFILSSHYGKINLLVLFAATFISYFAAMIPIMPGGIGTFEGMMSGILLIYGISLEQSLAISLIFRFVTFWFVVLFSVFVIIIWKVFLFKKGKSNAN